MIVRVHPDEIAEAGEALASRDKGEVPRRESLAHHSPGGRQGKTTRLCGEQFAPLFEELNEVLVT